MALYATHTLRTPATHSPSLACALDSIWTRCNSVITSFVSATVSRFAQSGVLSILLNIEFGALTIQTDEEIFTFGLLDEDGPKATLRVRNPVFWVRVALYGDLGFAESYMDGDADCPDVSYLLKVFIANRHRLGKIDNVSTLMTVGRRLTAYRFRGDLSTSRANISAHYDLGNILFESFLSKDMNYSSALFKDFNEDLRAGVENKETLEDAQIRKMKNLLNKLKIQPGDRVLEVGTGWGSLSILAAQCVPDIKVDTITLSSEQHDLASSRIALAGMSDRITVHLMDFREMRSKPDWAGMFDKFISVEMIENVGNEFIEEYWSIVDWAMKPIKATGVVQVITMPEARIPAYDAAGVDFIQKWIFPGCYIPSLAFLISTLTSGSSGRLTVDSVSNIGPHYARTLREWKRKFLSNWDRTILPSLQQQYNLDAEGLEIFKRKWIYYFDYCEAGFATRTLGDHIITFTREGNADFGCDVDPLLVT